MSGKQFKNQDDFENHTYHSEKADDMFKDYNDSELYDDSPPTVGEGWELS